MAILFRNLLALIAGVAALVLAFMFSLVLLALFVLVGCTAWAWFWWKTRKARAAGGRRPGGAVIDGEVIVVDDNAPRSRIEVRSGTDREP